jgi:uncharacterized membrane protein YoaK (UPF0700 family)
MIYRSIAVLRSLASVERTQVANIRLASVLAFIAGSINAGGFLAVRQYTSHMSGIVSAMADNIALANYALVLAGLAAVTSFIAGAMLCAIVTHWGGRLLLHSRYALALVIESALLVAFSIRGSAWDQHKLLPIPMTVSLLCFIMGFQNAIITRISNAEIRTTHITGMVTDIGIELGKLMYLNLSPSAQDSYPGPAGRPVLSWRGRRCLRLSRNRLRLRPAPRNHADCHGADPDCRRRASAHALKGHTDSRDSSGSRAMLRLHHDASRCQSGVG